MLVVMVYDVDVKRVAKALKIGRRYLRWVQNSVFEGELTTGRLSALKAELEDIIDPEHDSVLFYIWPTPQYVSRKELNTSRTKRRRFNFI